MKTLLATFLMAFALTAAAQETVSGFETGGMKFSVPKEWKAEKPSSAMRKAQYKIGEAEVVVFYFGKGQGGSVDANVARWLGQFKEPKEELGAKTEKKEVGTGSVTTVSANGTFMSGPPFGEKVAKAGYALRGAIVVGAEGPVFVKMTGPAKAVEAAAEAFDAAAASGLKEEEK